jgi:hypothetical protein
MKKKYSHFAVRIKALINKLIDEGYKLSEGTDLSNYERDQIIKRVIDEKVQEGIQHVFEEMKIDTTTTEVELINEIEELKVIVEKYCKKRLNLE